MLDNKNIIRLQNGNVYTDIEVEQIDHGVITFTYEEVTYLMGGKPVTTKQRIMTNIPFIFGEKVK